MPGNHRAIFLSLHYLFVFREQIEVPFIFPIAKDTLKMLGPTKAASATHLRLRNNPDFYQPL
jgi:hypothetical protein